MFQEFRTCLFDNSFISFMGLYNSYASFFKINSFFFQGTVRFQTVFPVIAMQRFDFKNIIIANKIFNVRILNMYLTSE